MEEALTERLRQAENREHLLRSALGEASIGHWSWTIGKPMQWDNTMLKLFGLNQQDSPPGSLDDWLPLLKDSSMETTIEAFDAAIAEQKSIDIQVALEKSGKVLHLSGHPLQLDESNELTLSGLCREVPAPSSPPDTTAQEPGVELANFASVASHDLREPLRMVSSYLRLLEERAPDALDDRALRYIKYACEGADRMRKLIEDLLSYARISHESVPAAPVALAEVLTETINILSNAIREERAEVNIAFEHSPYVLGDRTSLVRLFQNLISNAIKFHAPGQTPEVSINLQDGEQTNKPGFWIVSVQDNGIGIDPEHQDLLFEIFKRLHTRDEYEGSGIGLAICRKIVDRLGGRISLNSEKNKGTTFSVHLRKP